MKDVEPHQAGDRDGYAGDWIDPDLFTDPDDGDAYRRGLQEGRTRQVDEKLVALAGSEQVAMYLADWLSKARFVRRLPADEKWPAWSTGELLAVSLILNDTEMLAALEYTRNEALDRLRFDIGQPTVEAAGEVFARLRAQLEG